MSPDLVKKPLYFDVARRRLWIRGQRCHHGATGAVLAAGAVVLAATRSPASLAMLAAGGVLMVHDWKDRSMWFERGWQNQP